jgi:hypothetical protein
MIEASKGCTSVLQLSQKPAKGNRVARDWLAVANTVLLP